MTLSEGANHGCRDCGHVFPRTLEFFGPEHGRPGTRCRECHRIYQSAQRAKNPEAWRGYRRKWYEQNREHVQERDRQYREDNHEHRLQSARQWRANNRERIREYGRKWRKQLPAWRKERIRQSDSYRRYHRKWRAKNRERVLAYNRHRAARKRGAEGAHTGKDIEQLKQLQKNRCWWCGEALNADYHVDHRLPLSRGGSDDPSNLVLSCPGCNLRKNAMLPSEFVGRLL